MQTATLGFDSRSQNPEIKSPEYIKILILWTVTPSLVQVFHAAYCSLHLHRLLWVTIVEPRHHGHTSSYRAGSPYGILLARNRKCPSWGTQAIHYSMGQLHDSWCRTNTSSARIQDFDEICGIATRDSANRRLVLNHSDTVACIRYDDSLIQSASSYTSASSCTSDCAAQDRFLKTKFWSKISRIH